MTELLRSLPSLSALLERPLFEGLLAHWRRDVALAVAREVLEDERAFLRRGKGLKARYGHDAADREAITRHCEVELQSRLEALLEPRLHVVINATGVLLHTNLGRARLAESVADEVRRIATEPVALEVDLRSGQRGSRNARVGRWLSLLTGAEAGLATNNGAAALWLAVRALSKRGRSVLVSRGEQVAIGGSFRMPELMRTTGAKMVEVGTTNKTSVDDYAAELVEGDVVLKVHPSNYRIEGFCEEASLADLAQLCRERGAVLLFDAGSGSLYDFREFGLQGEDTITETLRAGVDVVTFSGDKLLGGPQAGLVVGREDLVRRMGRHPLMRALRCDKLILGALELTLATYARTAGDSKPALPLFESLEVPVSELQRRAERLASKLAPHMPSGWSVKAQASSAVVGGGSFAEHPVPSAEVLLAASDARAAASLHRDLRQGRPCVLARIDNERIAFDLRSMTKAELEVVGARVTAALEAVPAKA